MKKISRISVILEKEYGRPRFVFYSNPLDELIITVLSQNTSWQNTDRSYNSLKRRFRSWQDVLESSTSSISGAIRSGGLGNIKARRIKGILKEIKKQTGRLSLQFLKKKDTQDALLFLRSLKGVGPKTAAVVSLFSLKRPVLPVDTHILRVSKRLGLIPKKTTLQQAHDLLGRMVPKNADKILVFHVDLIQHGRKVCKAQNPRCNICALKRLCKYYKEAKRWR